MKRHLLTPLPRLSFPFAGLLLLVFSISLATSATGSPGTPPALEDGSSGAFPDYPSLPEVERRRLLDPPEGPVRMVLDTDTYNEIDDQFAVVYALLSPERLEVEALYAAPFLNERSTSPADGMEKSHEEILRLLDRLDRSPEGWVFRGSDRFLPDAHTPVESPAMRDLIERSREFSSGDPLYVVAVGAITNVASAILADPSLIERIVVVWLGGTGLHFPYANEFNLSQDTHAARVVFDSGVPLVHLPTQGVVTHLHTTLPEMQAYLAGRGRIGDYLLEIYKSYYDNHWPGRSKIIWDMAAIAWLIEARWLRTQLVPSPILTEAQTWEVDPSRPLIRTTLMLSRDAIFGDLFRKLELHAPE